MLWSDLLGLQVCVRVHGVLLLHAAQGFQSVHQLVFLHVLEENQCTIVVTTRKHAKGYKRSPTHQPGVMTRWAVPVSFFHHQRLPVNQPTDAAVQGMLGMLGVGLSQVCLMGNAQDRHGV